MNLLNKYLIIFLIGLSPVCFANENSNELKTMIRTIYPESVLRSSVHELVTYILDGTDYKVYVGENAPGDARMIFASKPGYQRKGVLMTRTDAILMAIGDENSVIVDHEKKLISVTRNPLDEN